ncbi:hypothetical protein J4234_06345 [Candidatus Woesearchaeota archaeon]|nr:hypothetical protein [Candidatus Woesearchaeota archaeon]
MFDETKDVNAAIEELAIILDTPIIAINSEFLKSFVDGFDEIYKKEKNLLLEAEKAEHLFQDGIRKSISLVFILFDRYVASRKPIENYKLLGEFFAALAVLIEVGFISSRFWENKTQEYLQQIQTLKKRTSNSIRNYGPFVNRLHKFINEKRGKVEEWQIEFLEQIARILSS